MYLHQFLFFNFFPVATQVVQAISTVLIKHMANAHHISIVSDCDELKQQKLTDVFISKSKSVMPLNSKDERFMLSRRLSLWFSKDLLPFSMVENVGFTNFWKALNIGIPLPSRHTISIAALNDMFSCIKKELISIISTNAGNTKQKYRR